MPMLVDIVIKDPETGRVLPQGGRGEICIKSIFNMKGYVNKPEDTAKVIDADGYFRTKDLEKLWALCCVFRATSFLRLHNSLHMRSPCWQHTRCHCHSTCSSSLILCQRALRGKLIRRVYVSSTRMRHPVRQLASSEGKLWPAGW